MPRKDPITGCEVLTLGEFFKEEANKEGNGRSGGELMSEMFDDITASCRQEEDSYKSNPSAVLDKLREEVDEYNKADPTETPIRKPALIKEVLAVEVKTGMRKSSLSIKASAVDEDGVEGTIIYNAWNSSGSFYEPPDGEINIYWE